MSKSRRKFKRFRISTEDRTRPQNGPASRTFWTKAQFVVAASGWVFAGLVVALDAPAKVNSFFRERDAAWHNVADWYWDFERYDGSWTNDPNLEPDKHLITDGSVPPDRGTLQLSLVEDGSGGFDGEIVTSQLAKHHAWSRVSVSGHFGLRGFKGEVWDIIEGQHRTLAYFTVAPSDEFGGDALNFTADKNFDRIVPTKALIWRSSGEMSQGEFGEDFVRLHESAAKTQRKTRFSGSARVIPRTEMLVTPPGSQPPKSQANAAPDLAIRREDASGD